MRPIVFDESNPNWSAVHLYNKMFIEACEKHAANMLLNRGFLTLNQVYEMLGFNQTEEGALIGWVKDVPVDFGIKSGLEGPIELTFNINSTNVFRDK